MVQTTDRHRLVLVTGPSGAGRSTAINALEDLDYETIDNLPLSLIARLFSGPPMGRALALGIDVRNRDFSVPALWDALETLKALPGLAPELLYLDCAPKTLARRYSETRRRHPLAPAESPVTGIARERDLLAPVRDRADVLIDTTELSPHTLRAEIDRWFAPGGAGNLAVSVQSFSYKRGLPPGIDMAIDCRFLRNPYWDESIRHLTGRDPAVGDYVAQDPNYGAFYDRLMNLVDMLLPAYLAEGKSHFSLGLGCTGGRHRSVFMAETVGQALAHGGWQVSIRHREISGQSSPSVSLSEGQKGHT